MSWYQVFDKMASWAVVAGLCVMIWMQVDTWKQARQTNDFIRHIRDAVATPPSALSQEGGE